MFLLARGIALCPISRILELDPTIEAIPSTLVLFPRSSILADDMLKTNIVTGRMQPTHEARPLPDQRLMAYLNGRFSTLICIGREQTSFHEDIHCLSHQTRLLRVNKNGFGKRGPTT